MSQTVEKPAGLFCRHIDLDRRLCMHWKASEQDERKARQLTHLMTLLRGDSNVWSARVAAVFRNDLANESHAFRGELDWLARASREHEGNALRSRRFLAAPVRH